ncbi:hypothetical protein MMC17_004852 [Xylographa soralifera]|nr:hypothetical protein [Xylographa soralifera]
MPAYLDFISMFGAQVQPRELRFSGFSTLLMIHESSHRPGLPALGRSGRLFQLCYNLVGVSLKATVVKDLKLREWSVRQAAIHHQFDIINGTTLWIVTKGRIDIQQRFKQLTGANARAEDKAFTTLFECFRSSLAAHLMYCSWSTEDWHGYIRWLEDVLEAETTLAIYGRRSRGSAYQEYQQRHIQELQNWKDKTSEVIMLLEANMTTLTALQSFYVRLRRNKDFPALLKAQCEDEIQQFASEIDQMIHGFKMFKSRAFLLAGIISDRRELIEKVLHQFQEQYIERTEVLSKNLEKEAIGMRIITIITLLYLPATFVSVRLPPLHGHQEQDIH